MRLMRQHYCSRSSARRMIFLEATIISITPLVRKTEMWIASGGLEKDGIPSELRSYKHRTA